MGRYVKPEIAKALVEAGATQRIVLKMGEKNSRGEVFVFGPVDGVVLKVEVTLIKVNPTTYKFLTGDTQKPSKVSKTHPKFLMVPLLSQNTLEVMGRFRDLERKRFL